MIGFTLIAGFALAFLLTILAAAYFAVVGAICVEFFCHSFRFKARTIYLILMGSFLTIGFLWLQAWAVVEFLPVFFLAIAPVRTVVYFQNKAKGDYLGQFALYRRAVFGASAMSALGLTMLAIWAFQNMPSHG